MTTFTNSKKREILDVAAAKGAFFSVTFVKADNTIREMTCKKWTEKAFTNGSANAGVNTCAGIENLYTVVDVVAENKKGTKGAFRNINLDTLLEVKYSGRVVKF